jgi:hypothetical protein
MLNIVLFFITNFVYSFQSTDTTCSPNLECGALKIYYYGNIKFYLGSFGVDCQVKTSDLQVNFLTLFPKSKNTRFLSEVGLPFEELVVNKG